MTTFSTQLQTGAGLCTPTHMLVLRTAAPALELGAAPDVIMGVLNAVHHVNRHGGPDDRIAIALPGLRRGRGRHLPGVEVIVFGSLAALDRLRKTEGVDRLRRRGMMTLTELAEAVGDPRAPGTAFVRDRRAGRRSPGAVRRARARAERRGLPFPEQVRHEMPAGLALHYGNVVVHVRAVAGQVSADPVWIGTYGFSPVSAPAVLPITLCNADIRGELGE